MKRNDQNNINYRGGRHGDLAAIPGTEKHHMPPWNAFPPEMKMHYGEVPVIQMDKKDHRKTLGWGPGKKAENVRIRLEKLLRKGKYEEAVQEMLDDVRIKFPGKYDEAINEFLPESEKYEKIFLENLKNI